MNKFLLWPQNVWLPWISYHTSSPWGIANTCSEGSTIYRGEANHAPELKQRRNLDLPENFTLTQANCAISGLFIVLRMFYYTQMTILRFTNQRFVINLSVWTISSGICKKKNITTTFLAPLSEDSSGAYQILIEPSSVCLSVRPSTFHLNLISSYSCYWILLKLGAVVPWDRPHKQMKRFFQICFSTGHQVAP